MYQPPAWGVVGEVRGLGPGLGLQGVRAPASPVRAGRSEDCGGGGEVQDTARGCKLTPGWLSIKEQVHPGTASWIGCTWYLCS